MIIIVILFQMSKIMQGDRGIGYYVDIKPVSAFAKKAPKEGSFKILLLFDVNTYLIYTVCHYLDKKVSFSKSVKPQKRR